MARGTPKNESLPSTGQLGGIGALGSERDLATTLGSGSGYYPILFPSFLGYDYAILGSCVLPLALGFVLDLDIWLYHISM